MKEQIDLSQYSEDQLIELNRRIVERLNSLHQHRRFEEMARFNLGDMVSFTAEQGRMVVGKVARVNAKTITIISINGQRWRVSPALLSHTTDGEVAGAGQPGQGQGKHLSLIGPAVDRSRRP